jgi:hypothetical protein
MKPVRVKVYGLLSLTKRTYLVLQGIGLLFVVVLMILTVVLPRPKVAPGAQPSPWITVVVWLLDNFLWIGLLTLFLEAIETVVVLGRFARQEALQKATDAATQPPT